jgi:hypothetical protein
MVRETEKVLRAGELNQGMVAARTDNFSLAQEPESARRS